VLNATFNNISVISWQSILLVEETGVPRENHWLVSSKWQTWSHKVVSSSEYTLTFSAIYKESKDVGVQVMKSRW